MTLVPDTVLKEMPLLYATEHVAADDKMMLLHFSSPLSGWHWFAVEYDPAERIFFGLVFGFEVEWGYFSLDEFESMEGAIVWDKAWLPRRREELPA